MTNTQGPTQGRPQEVPLASLRIDRPSWAREELSEERAAMFEGIFREGGELPPIEIADNSDGTYTVCEGITRSFGAKRAGLDTIQAVIIEPLDGESVSELAFRRSLETAIRSSLPLTRSERRRATLRLLAIDPSLSRREVARRVGVAHASVDRWVNESEQPTHGTSEGESPNGTPYSVGPSADDVARRVATYFARLDEARGLFDMLAQSRMGKHLATAFEDRFGDDALAQAERLANWAAGAVTQLRTTRS